MSRAKQGGHENLDMISTFLNWSDQFMCRVIMLKDQSMYVHCF